MEHKDITNLEMEDMREQISALKQMLANEEIINDRILRSATSSRISTIQRKGILSIAIGILGAPYCAFVFYQLGLSWYFIGATIAMLIFCASCTAVMHNRVKSNTASTGSLLECAKQIKKLKKEYKTFEEFRDNFELPEEVLQEVFDEAEKAKVKPKDEEERQRSIPMLKSQLKALIARDIWDMSQYFQIINEENHIVRKAVELLGK